MKQEEKAKRYDEVLESIKELYSKGSRVVVSKKEFENIFPELAESEDDRIKKEIIDFIYDKTDTYELREKSNSWLAWLEKQGDKDKLIQELGKYKAKYTQDVLEKHINSMSNKDDERLRKTTIAFLKDFAEQGYENAVECIDWLEKQGGQKSIFDFNANNWYVSNVDGKIHDLTYNPADKTQQRFKVGDWVVKGNVIAQILDVQEQYYIGLDTEGNDFTASRFLSDDKIHLWTIQDAKDGDVLAAEDKDKVFVYNGKLDLRGRVCAYCGIYKTYDGVHFTECAIGIYFTYKEPHPATKEQRDLLFQKMKEVGCEFDFDKKELKRIVVPIFNIGDTIAKKHNSDINKFGQFTITDITDGKYWYNDSIICDIAKQDEWEIYENEQDTPYIDSDDVRRRSTIQILEYARSLNTYNVYGKETIDKNISWLEKQALKLKWNEEDEHRLEDTIYFLNTAKTHYASTVELDACVDWLYSLKKRIRG